MQQQLDLLAGAARPSDVPPDVASKFIEYARKVKGRGLGTYSAKAIIEIIRWHMEVEQGVRAFKINNNWAPKLARWAMHADPQLRGMFNLRITNEDRRNHYG